jgi:hypothetical protein
LERREREREREGGESSIICLWKVHGKTWEASERNAISRRERGSRREIECKRTEKERERKRRRKRDREGRKRKSERERKDGRKEVRAYRETNDCTKDRGKNQTK